MVDYQKVFRDLKSNYFAISSAVISRDGTLIAGDMPEGVTPETLTIMCATMMGAAVTAHSALRIGTPKIIRMISDNHEMFMAIIGPNALIVTVVPKGTKVEGLQHMLETLGG